MPVGTEAFETNLKFVMSPALMMALELEMTSEGCRANTFHTCSVYLCCGLFFFSFKFGYTIMLHGREAWQCKENCCKQPACALQPAYNRCARTQNSTTEDKQKQTNNKKKRPKLQQTIRTLFIFKRHWVLFSLSRLRPSPKSLCYCPSQIQVGKHREYLFQL